MDASLNNTDGGRAHRSVHLANELYLSSDAEADEIILRRLPL